MEQNATIAQIEQKKQTKNVNLCPNFDSINSLTLPESLVSVMRHFLPKDSLSNIKVQIIQQIENAETMEKVCDVMTESLAFHQTLISMHEYFKKKGNEDAGKEHAEEGYRESLALHHANVGT